MTMLSFLVPGLALLLALVAAAALAGPRHPGAEDGNRSLPADHGANLARLP
jgi:hypothetical protein